MNSIAPSISDQMTQVYVFVDDYLKQHPAQAAWRRFNNDAPAFTDAEVITVGLLQGAFGCATLKKTYQLAAANWRSAFPRLCSYGQWMARLHTLSALVGQLLQAAIGLCGLSGRLYMIDGLPIRMCKSIRHGRVRLSREDGAYFGKSTTGGFFGFKLHAIVHPIVHPIVHHSRTIVSAILTPANFDEREVAVVLALSVEGSIMLGDLGYRSHKDWLAEMLAEDTDMLLIHPVDTGAKREDEKLNPRRALISSVRERVETSFGGLWQRFIDRNLSRS